MVSYTPSGDEGPSSYIEIVKARNKLSEPKGNNKKQRNIHDRQQTWTINARQKSSPTAYGKLFLYA
jgi:hypothetical protein